MTTRPVVLDQGTRVQFALASGTLKYGTVTRFVTKAHSSLVSIMSDGGNVFVRDVRSVRVIEKHVAESDE